MLRGEVVLLRLAREDDLHRLYERMSDLAARGSFFPLGLTGEPTFRRQFEKTGFWDEDEGMLLMVDRAGVMVGEIEFYPIAHYLQGYEISYLLFGAEHSGKGYAPEALQLLVAYLFGRRPINRLQLNIHPDNEASKRVAGKSGFTFEGIMRGCWFHQGRFNDLEIWSILRDEAVVTSAPV